MAKKLLLVLFVALIALMPMGSAWAQGGPQGKPDLSDPVALKAFVEQIAANQNPAKAWADLTPEEHAAVMKYLRVVRTVESDSGDVGIMVNCKNKVVTRSGYNALGQTLWTYFQDISWCYDGSKITVVNYRHRWGEVYAPFWEFVGHIGDSTSGGAGQWSYRAWTQGSYRLCAAPGGIGCVQFAYPWIDETVYGNGNATWSTGG